MAHSVDVLNITRLWRIIPMIDMAIVSAGTLIPEGTDLRITPPRLRGVVVLTNASERAQSCC